MFDLRFHLHEYEQAKRDKGDPNLIVDSVLARSVQMLDLQMLLHPFKERLDCPATAIHLADFITSLVEAIGHQKEKEQVAFRILCLYHPQQMLHLLQLGADLDAPIGRNRTSFRESELFQRLDMRIAFQACDE